MLREVPHLTVDRDGDTVVARTDLGRAERVVIAGHLDTVPLGDNLPCRVEDGRIHGCGTTDMKSGVAVQLRLAAHLAEPNRDVTYVFYDHEEVEADKNGLGRVAPQPPRVAGRRLRGADGADQRHRRGRLPGHPARRRRAARPPRALGAVLAGQQRGARRRRGPAQRLAAYDAAEVVIDGLTYREGLNAVGISGGVAGNVIPDECRVTVNYRFAPDKSEEQAAARRAPGARRLRRRGLRLGARRAARPVAPGCGGLRRDGRPRAAAQVRLDRRGAVLGPRVCRRSTTAPGDPGVAHQREEYCDIAPILECEQTMRAWLGA